MTSAGTLPDDLVQLRDRLAAVPFALDTPGRDAAVRAVRSVVDQVDDHLLPRLRDVDAPLLVVVGGSTGAGKSTLVNSLLQAEVTRAGVLRPTTRTPVLVCAPADRGAFADDRVLPVQVEVHPAVPEGLALVDAPDVDSVVEANRDLAGQLLSAADLWVFVTTAARYADAVPWDLLRTAAERGTALAVVLDRVPPEATREVAADLAGMLERAGLAQARLWVVEERPLVDGFLPEDQVAPLRGWLRGLAADAEARAEVVRQTLVGALASLDDRVAGIARAVDEQAAAAGALHTAADAAYGRAATAVDEGVRNGTLLRGEVLARWQEFVGTGEWMRSLQAGIGRLRDRVTAAVTGRATPAQDLTGALESGVERLLRSAAETAAEDTVTAWRGLPGGAGVVAGRERDLSTVGPGFAEDAGRTVRDWQGAVLELVRGEGAGKRSRARLLSWGVNGAGAVVMVAVFAQTAGLSGAEVAVAGGTTVVGQRVLEAVFGDSAVRQLAERARRDLDERTGALLHVEHRRFTELLDGAAGPDDAVALRESARTVAAARG
ncbi:ABC transporter [Klenkia taihuensis]|uniref:Dynamin family protein n=1 Tax=Klenkia taihuensis TaxID=1225127 RepID=A0A1I1GEE2_9ACTN|nr:ABC transporter [Klenkia taihuensis]GHE09776.1 ABC transporter [Klenkia taihuensis]SFC10137.1 Dynamin family protein [Klenkia taihuensis]